MGDSLIRSHQDQVRKTETGTSDSGATLNPLRRLIGIIMHEKTYISLSPNAYNDIFICVFAIA